MKGVDKFRKLSGRPSQKFIATARNSG